MELHIVTLLTNNYGFLAMLFIIVSNQLEREGDCKEIVKLKNDTLVPKQLPTHVSKRSYNLHTQKTHINSFDWFGEVIT